MNSLTNKERERIFAMYYGAEMLSSFKEPFKVNGDIIQDISSVWPMHNVAKLLLIPLSKITDEHAIEVANALNIDCRWVNILSEDLPVRLFGISNYDKSREFQFRITEYEEIYLWATNDSWKTYTNIASLYMTSIVDILRELGYALPYKGQSLFELGIAIDKSTLNK